MLKVKYFARGSWLVRYTAIVTVLTILPLNGAPGQEGAKNSKKIVKQRDGDSPKFDVLISRSDDKKKSEPGKPVAIAITFADGSTQNVDIGKYGFVTIDVHGQRVLMHPAGHPPKLITGPTHALLADVSSDKGPVRIPLPKEFASGKGPIEDTLREKATKKNVDKTKTRTDDDRLNRLEAMLHDLQKQMKSLQAEIKRRD